MNKREVSRSKIIGNSYAFGVGIVFVCLIFAYIAWQHPISEDEATVEQIISKPIVAEEPSVFNPNPEFVINEGDTLVSVLNEAEIEGSMAHSLVNAFAKKYNPRKLNIGTVVALNFESEANPTLKTMVVTISNNLKIEVSNNGNGSFSAVEVVMPLVRQAEYRNATIKNSFAATANELAIPSNAVMSMIRAFSYDVDFQRDIKRGDKIEVLMDKYYTKDGKLSHTGDILYSSLTIGEKKVTIYLYKNKDGDSAYYNEKGESIRKEFLRTPMNVAKISSRYGMRNHPVLGYSRMHKGVDFAAPVGTPILAAGSGVIETAARYGQYGKYVRIKHNSSYSTAYAHASRFAKGVKPGAKVSQGQVIAYVGTTGVTSGAHLHYEVLENGRHINPLKFKFSSSNNKLEGKELTEFKKFKKNIEKQLSSS